MSAAWLSLCAAIAGQPLVLDAGERQTFALIADAPSDVIQEAGALFRKHTDLTPIEVPAEAIEGCRGSPVCIALRARAHLEKQSASFLAVISTVSGRISALLIDLDAAIECADAGGDEEAIANCATERALVASSLAQAVEGRDAMRRHVEDLVLRVFRPALERSGHWEPFGAIDVTIARAVVSIDGRAIGSVEGRARIEGLRPGTRRITLEHAGSVPQEIQVEVKRGEVATIATELAPIVGTHPARTITLWSGVGIAAIGIGISIWAAVASGSELYCFQEDCDRRFQTFRSLTDEDGDHSGPPRNGLLALPFGYSLAGAGAAFSLGALFIGAEEDLPWIAWLIGAAVGGLAYGLSALAQ